MFDTQAQPEPLARADSEIQYDLCVIGAGIAGLNALYVATEYLPKGARVALIDRRARCGGMWNDTYDYVRLHQPHPMFTTGNRPWDWSKPSSYLAKRGEVREHLGQCLGDIKGKLDIDEIYGAEVVGTQEVLEGGAAVALVTYRDVATGKSQTIRTKQVIDAIGIDVPQSAPLSVTSTSVLSTTPIGLRHDLSRNKDAHAVVVGGGKTGMDTILAILEENPDREITLLCGKGTFFASRDQFFPEGASRYWSGSTIFQAFRDLSQRFDGTNESDVNEYFKRTYAISPTPEAQQFLFGLLSKDECARIEDGLSAIHYDYLEDVADGPDGPELVLRGGSRIPVPAGTMIINCTGHVLRNNRPQVPILSEHGTILTISTRASIHFLSTVSAYFLTHLLYRRQLRDVPLYVIDHNQMMAHGRHIFHIGGVMQAYYNTLVLIDVLPMSVILRCGLDFDRWYPMYRRMASLAPAMISKKSEMARCRGILDDVAQRTGVLCAPLSAG
ncbi:MAG: FAD-dependent oxidoreductase [Rhodobacteraceae bacterium]|nr:FAD-dependent oxidoreductase [Paracoccaceae bacterium]